MAGIFNGPPRGGTRGGKDQFNWDNVKADKEREYYLGHSVKALTGRWQKGKDVYWYTRDVDRSDADKAAELAMVKQREQDLMMEALGVKPKAPKQLKQPQLDQQDMQKLMQGTGQEDEEGGGAGAAAAAAVADADRMKGLGFHASMTTGAIQAGTDHEMLAGVGNSNLAGPGSGAGTQQPAAASRQQQQQQKQQPGGGAGPALMLTQEQIAELKRLHKKKEKKAAKQAKKEAKKAKRKHKGDKKKKRSRSSSSGGSSSSDFEGARVTTGQQAEQPPHMPLATRRQREEPEREQMRQRSRSRSRGGRSSRRHDSLAPRRRHDSPEPRRRGEQEPGGRREQERTRSPPPARRRHDSP